MFAGLVPGRRIRAHQPLIDRGGACTLIYDLERGRLIDVPLDYHYHVAIALESGELDEGLMSWLLEEDLLTFDGAGDDWQPVAGPLWGVEDGRGLGSVFLDGGELHYDPGAGEPSGELLRTRLRPPAGTPLVVHLKFEAGGAGELAELIDRFAGDAGAAGREVRFEVSGRVTGLTGGVARLLRSRRDLRVRLACSFPGAGGAPAVPRGHEARRWLESLAPALGPRLAVHVVLARGNRLAELWSWAGELGLERLDASRAGAYRWPEPHASAADDQLFQGDLAAVCDSMFDSLEQGLPRPLLFEPVARVVRGLIAGAGAAPAVGGYRALVQGGEVIWPPVAGLAVAGPASPQPAPCAECWAQALCSRSVFVRRPQAAPDSGSEPREDRCETWRREIEAALHFFRRLQLADPEDLLGFPLDGVRAAAPPVLGVGVRAAAGPLWVC
jgi:hypothetical protein